jgi:hypothetical protein
MPVDLEKRTEPEAVASTADLRLNIGAVVAIAAGLFLILAAFLPH